MQIINVNGYIVRGLVIERVNKKFIEDPKASIMKSVIKFIESRERNVKEQ